jgi:hypothetical protein
MSEDQDWSQWRTSVIDDCLSRVYIVACSGTVQVSSLSCMPVPLFLGSRAPNADCHAGDVCRIYLMRDANGSASVSLLGLAAASEQRARTADHAQAQSWHSCNCLRLRMLPSLGLCLPSFSAIRFLCAVLLPRSTHCVGRDVTRKALRMACVLCVLGSCLLCNGSTNQMREDTATQRQPSCWIVRWASCRP